MFYILDHLNALFINVNKRCNDHIHRVGVQDIHHPVQAADGMNGSANAMQFCLDRPQRQRIMLKHKNGYSR